MPVTWRRPPGGSGWGGSCSTRSVRWLREQGCVGVDGTALPGDRGAKNFYESAGFKARMLTMHRELDGRSDPD